jgi:hypothetical protein
MDPKPKNLLVYGSHSAGLSVIDLGKEDSKIRKTFKLKEKRNISILKGVVALD